MAKASPARFSQPLDANLLSAAILTMVVGLVVAWKWEGIGGLLIAGGFIFFTAVSHGVRLNLVFRPMLGVGVVYLICGWLRT